MRRIHSFDSVVEMCTKKASVCAWALAGNATSLNIRSVWAVPEPPSHALNVPLCAGSFESLLMTVAPATQPVSPTLEAGVSARASWP